MTTPTAIALQQADAIKCQADSMMNLAVEQHARSVSWAMDRILNNTHVSPEFRRAILPACTCSYCQQEAEAEREDAGESLSGAIVRRAPLARLVKLLTTNPGELPG